MSTKTPSLSAISDSLADAVEAAAPFVVGVRTGRRRATGISVGGGEVVTSAHALRHSGGSVSVQLADGTVAPAELLGGDPATDLALLRVNAEGLEAAPWADADAGPRVGHLVLAVGRPGDSARTTLGAVSALGGAWRSRHGGSIDSYIDVDGALPGGFSGGPLIDGGGAFLGLNTSRLTPGGTTIPASTVLRVAAAIREQGDLKRGWLGVVIQATELPEGTDADYSAGLLITGVAGSSPAAEAGVVSGDVLLAIDGAATTSFADLAAALAGRIGDEVPLTVLRHGTRTELSATVGERRRRRAC